MKKFHFLSPLASFSEPQAVLLLLGWLRLITASLLLILCFVIEWLDIMAVQTLLNWPVIIVCCLVILGLSFFTSLFKHKEISQIHLLIVLLFDIFCWVGFIFASGGSINPAISYLVVLLAIGALALSAKQASLLTFITVFLYGLMMNVQPQIHIHSANQENHMMGWHLWGMWVLFMLNSVIMLIVIAFLSRALREKDKAISLYREETVRNEQLVSMGTMAANIAHELGTPLSTIAILIDDMENESTQEDRNVIKQQIERCKNALSQLKFTSATFTEAQRCNSSDFLLRLVHESLLLKPEAIIEWHDQVKKDLLISPLFEQALLALLNNAIDAAAEYVILKCYQDNVSLILDIQHDGAQINEALLKTLGHKIVESNKNGLGLGYYLANATVERLGGRLQISNLEQGVLTRMVLPWEKFCT